MDPSQQKPEENSGQQPAGEQPAPQTAQQTAPEDALNKSTEELNAEAAAQEAANPTDKPEEVPVKQSAFKKFWKRVDIYLLGFGLLVIIGAAVATVSYLNGKKTPPAAELATQTLTQDALKTLANSDATIGNAAQTLTVQGNAVFDGQVLVRSNLNVAGNIQLGGQLLAPSLTVSGNTNLNATQINSLQVAQNTAIQGTTTLRDLNVAGAATFGNTVTASQITVTRLILSGNAVLQVPNHIAFTGPSPSRTGIDTNALGAGGTASINGSDTTGTININSGNSPGSGCFIRMNFNQAFTGTPHVLISPVNSGAGSLDYYVTRTSTGFSLCSNNAPPANQVFAFDYFVTS
jgi:cytoskeletal protein CcmA (bactofilin family)